MNVKKTKKFKKIVLKITMSMTTARRPVLAGFRSGERPAQNGNSSAVEHPCSGGGGDPSEGVLPANSGCT